MEGFRDIDDCRGCLEEVNKSVRDVKVNLCLEKNVPR
jgi:hypothetical protein